MGRANCKRRYLGSYADEIEAAKAYDQAALQLHVGGRETGWLFCSRQGGHYSKQRIQQIVRSVAEDADIQKRVYPHLLRHTAPPAAGGRGNERGASPAVPGPRGPETTQRYYEPKRTQVKGDFGEATGS